MKQLLAAFLILAICMQQVTCLPTNVHHYLQQKLLVSHPYSPVQRKILQHTTCLYCAVSFGMVNTGIICWLLQARDAQQRAMQLARGIQQLHNIIQQGPLSLISNNPQPLEDSTTHQWFVGIICCLVWYVIMYHVLISNDNGICQEQLTSFLHNWPHHQEKLTAIRQNSTNAAGAQPRIYTLFASFERLHKLYNYHQHNWTLTEETAAKYLAAVQTTLLQIPD